MTKIEKHSSAQKTGMKCPQCDTFIEISIFQLLTAQVLKCPACSLKLNIDRVKSKPAFDALHKVQQAQQNLEEKRKFNK